MTLTFALLLSALIFFVGMAVDVGSAYSAKYQLDAITDSASLAGATRARSEFLSSGVGSEGKTAAILKSASDNATAFFESQAPDVGSVTSQATVTVEYADGQVTSKVTYTATYRPHLLKIFGFDHIPIAGKSVSAAALVPYMEVTLLIDTSGSMAIGADAAEQTQLKNEIGCAFACHDNAAVKGYADSYAYAKAKGITLRYDAINNGIVKLIDEFDSLDPSATAIRGSVWSFDTKFNVKQDMTTSRSKLRWNLPTAPAMSGKTQGATKFKEGIADVVASIGKGGDGSTPANPIKILIIATDGVQDPGRFWVDQPSYRSEVREFNMAFCETLKTKNVRVGVLHTPYIPMNYDWGYGVTLGMPSEIGGTGTRADDVPRVLKSCAGDLYFEASSSDKIAKGFVTILRSTNTTPRLVM